MNATTPPLSQSPNSKGQPPTPRPFHMTEPFYERGVWCFWLAADEEVLRFVSHLYCVLTVSFTPSLLQRRQSGRGMVCINPRYDHQEAWLWIYDLLEGECNPVELDELWEQAINMAFHDDSIDDGGWGE
jgi:hypothetical protein